MQMVKDGLLTREDMHLHPDKHVILQALGTRPAVHAATWEEAFPIRIGDGFILCSDGLSDLVEDMEIQQALLAYPADVACTQLIALARERGGYDNITVGFLGIRSPKNFADKNIVETREIVSL
jgi:protein phosphatase